MSIVFSLFVIVYIVAIFVIMGLVRQHVKRYKPIVLSFLTIILLLLPMFVPTWNYFLGKHFFEEYCKNDAGLHIYKEIERVDSLYIEDSKPYIYLGYDFIYVEAEEGGTYVKYFIEHNSSENCIYFNQAFLKSGQCISRVGIEQPKSRFALKRVEIWDSVTYLLNFRRSPVLYERETGEVIAALVDFKWNQGWVVSMMDSTSQQCLESRRGELLEELMSQIVYIAQ